MARRSLVQKRNVETFICAVAGIVVVRKQDRSFHKSTSLLSPSTPPGAPGKLCTTSRLHFLVRGS